MTKKDYEAIADILYLNRYYIADYSNLIDGDNAIEQLCTYFKLDNPNFKPDKFKEACGV